MKRKYGFGLLIALWMSNINVFAQSTDIKKTDNALHSFLRFKLSDISGFEWEQKIGRESVLTGFLGLIYGMAADGFSISKTPFNTKLQISPYSYVEYRNYYNLIHRKAMKRNITNNSANFLFAEAANIYPVMNQNYYNLLFLQGWGIQRTLGRNSLWRKIIFDCHLGIVEHFYYDKPPSGGFNYLKFEPRITGSLSYVF